jgi:hypothetical protein
MLRISLTFAKSSLCLVLLSRDGPTPWVVDGEADSPLIKDVCTPIDTPLSDMTLLVINSRRTYVTDSSTVVSSSNIRARIKIIGVTMDLDTALE